jgi:hypothetical protein
MSSRTRHALTGRGAGLAASALLVACGTPTKPAPAPTPSATPSTLTMAQAAKAYLAAAAPVNAAGTAFKAKVATWPASETGPEAEADVQPYIQADDTFRKTLLDTNWPTSIVADVHSLIAADARVSGDYSALGSLNLFGESTWETTEAADWVSLQSSVSVVRHDLGLSSSTQY